MKDEDNDFFEINYEIPTPSKKSITIQELTQQIIDDHKAVENESEDHDFDPGDEEEGVSTNLLKVAQLGQSHNATKSMD